jgi:trypsin
MRPALPRCRTAAVLVLLWALVLARPASGSASAGIFGGYSVNITEFPYQLALVGPDSVAFCGAVLLSRTLVITAQHCAVRSSSTRVVAGVTKITVWSNERTAQVLPVQSYILHPYYRSPSLGKDVALLQLPEPGFVLTPEVQPIPRLTFAQAQVLAQPGQVATISGWGMVLGFTFPNNLQAAQVHLFSLALASQAYGMNLSLDQIPAGELSGQVDTCQGDSGGPLTISVLGKPVLVGLTSWGQGCGVPGLPGMYVRVSEFDSWISLVQATLALPAPVSVPLLDLAVPALSEGTNYTSSFFIPPTGALRVDFAISFDLGLLDFYVQQGHPASLSDYECAAARTGPYAFSTCTLINPIGGMWYVTVVPLAADVPAGGLLQAAMRTGPGVSKHAVLARSGFVNVLPDTNISVTSLAVSCVVVWPNPPRLRPCTAPRGAAQRRVLDRHAACAM